MIILGIETSCDETALCLLEKKDSNYRVIHHLINSQIELHREYGGVFPMLAKREHIKNLPILYKKLLEESGVVESEINMIAVTKGPGLEPALWTGILFAKELGQKLSIPVIPVNHMEGHIVSSLISTISSTPENSTGTFTTFSELKNIEFPALAVLISGGHTELVAVEHFGHYTILGSTVDDAVGEAFDKVARMLKLPYPGGPEISKLAEQARKNNVEKTITLPRPMIHSKDLKFSFSGLKTAVLYSLKKFETISSENITSSNITPEQIQDIAREFEDAVTEVLISKTETALEENEVKTLLIGGGVIANTHIRKAFEALAHQHSIPIHLPASGLTGDNAVMIALVAAIAADKTSVEEKIITIKPSSSDEGLIDDFRAEGNLSF